MGFYPRVFFSLLGFLNFPLVFQFLILINELPLKKLTELTHLDKNAASLIGQMETVTKLIPISVPVRFSG